MKVFRQVGDNVVEVPDHRAAGMLGQAPNPVLPAHRFWATVAGHLLLWGNAFVEKLRDDQGLVSELWLIHPSDGDGRVQRHPPPETVSGRQRRRHPNPPSRTTGCCTCSATRTDGLTGLSPIRQARQQMGITKARERFEAEVYGQQPFTSPA